MAVEISDYSTCSNEQWMDIWSKCSWSTWFESPMWFHVWEKTYGSGYRPMPQLIQFSDGTCCIIPAMSIQRMKGLTQVYQISPAGTFGGPISESTLNKDHLRCLINFIASKWKNIHFRLNPYFLQTITDYEAKSNSDFLHCPDFTQSIRIDGDYNLIDKSLRSSQVRRDALSARKKGLFLDSFTSDELSDYLKAYRQSQSRWGKKSTFYPPQFFEALIDSHGCTFWGVRSSDGQIIGGGPIMEGNHIATSWLGLMRTDALKFRPYELFYFELIHMYRERGFTWLDLNPSGGNQGVVNFKNKFGARKLPAPYFKRSTGLLRLVDKVQGVNIQND
jgi:hypothetical protein